jgi:phosphohistidine swiveling domain-containing protein
MNKIKNYKTIVERKKFGGKAYWLSWLNVNNINIPPAIFIPIDLKKIEINDKNEIINFFSNNYINKKASFAVRSSATSEDGLFSSQAGVFNSKTNIPSIEIAIDTISKIQDGRGNVGVIIQEYINASYSGVIFSTNPNTGNKNDILINYTKGNSEELLNGNEIGKEIKLLFSEIEKKIEKEYPIDYKILEELIFITKKIEKELNCPVDIEWCVDENSNKLYIVQCRPITNLHFKKSELLKVSIENINKIPNDIKRNDKVKLRLTASNEKVLTTNAYLLLMNSKDYSKINILEEINNRISENKLNLGYCEVLIKPLTLNGGVLRMFSSNSNKDLANRIEEILELTFKNYWQSVIIFHELYELHYMGIIKKINSDYLIEVSYGGFIQKGITEFSQYFVDNKLNISKKKELIQKFTYEISDGKIKAVPIDKKIILSDRLIKTIIKTFIPFIDKELTIEFGISKCSKGYTPYLIDYIEDNTNITFDNISDGIISNGKIKGNVINIDINDDWKKSIQKHFHDGNDYHSLSKNKNDTIVFVADKPHISLVEIIENYDTNNIGFIFKEASILSHLCILLRENGIPAIISSKDYKNDETANINTLKNFA